MCKLEFVRGFEFISMIDDLMIWAKIRQPKSELTKQMESSKLRVKFENTSVYNNSCTPKYSNTQKPILILKQVIVDQITLNRFAPMPFVRQIALILNVGVSIYFCYYQICTPNKSEEVFEKTNQDSMLLKVTVSCLILVSPILHILALTHPSYCFNGHCPPPQHSQNQSDSPSNNYHHNSYQKINKSNPYPNIQFASNPKSRLNQSPSQNDDFIKESIASSKDQIPFNQKLFSPKNHAQTQNFKDNQGSVLFLKLHKVDSPSPYQNYFQEQQKSHSSNAQETNNVNEFSNLPFFRNSRRSLSNMGNNDSPRISRKSLNQLQPPSNLFQPLILTPATKRESSPEPTPKKQISSNFSSQATQSLPRMKIECDFCEDCQIPKYLRMKHCYRCQKCVHKYDHHCVLLDICVGEANQKYYIAFLYANLYNTVLLLIQLLELLKSDVQIDEVTGIEHLESGYKMKASGIILLIFNLILTGYLVFLHTKFFFNGSTTYEKQRRETINFFRFVKKNFYFFQALKHFDQDDLQTYHPFDEGCLVNPMKILTASGEQPYDWQLPYKECSLNIELKERKEKTKPHSEGKNNNVHFLGREWGEQSESSNNLHACKTTKSRQSVGRKSKEEEEKLIQKPRKKA